jgi:hypothetical protein
VSSSPNLKQAQKGTLSGFADQLKEDIAQTFDTMLPVEIVSYDRSKRLAKVQHLIEMIDVDDNVIDRGTQSNIHIVSFGGGGVVQDINLVAGDKGWIIACDRDISTFKQKFVKSAPNTLRKKNFSDAIFIPNVMTGYSVPSDDADAFVLAQSLDGSTKITLNPKTNTITMKGSKLIQEFSEIESTASSSFKITTASYESNASGTYTLKGGQYINQMSASTFSNSVLFSSGFTSSGSGVGPNGVDIFSHIHNQASDSHGDTQQPTSPPVSPPTTV